MTTARATLARTASVVVLVSMSLVGMVTHAPTASALCEPTTVSYCTTEVDGQTVQVYACPTLPCMWTDQRTGALYLVTDNQLWKVNP